MLPKLLLLAGGALAYLAALLVVYSLCAAAGRADDAADRQLERLRR